MIVKRKWLATYGHRSWEREGWYLFGLIPLYIRDMQPGALVRTPR